MAKIIVTGGTGYIGSHTVVELQQAGHEVVIIDNLSNSSIDVLHGIASITGVLPHFEKIDCTDFDLLQSFFDAHRDADAIIHFAASKAVNESVEKPLLYYKNNLLSLVNLLDLMPQSGISHLVFSSSCTVYGQPDILPVTENSPIKKALSPYGNTKQIGEDIITDTVKAMPDIKAIILRYFNPVGAHDSALIGELPNGVPQNLMPFVTQTAIGIRQQLKVFGNDYDTHDGSCIRDYIHVVDLAKAHVVAVERMLNKQTKKNPELFNIGTGVGFSVLEIVKRFQEVNNIEVPYEIVGRRAGDIEKVWADASLANDELGWKAVKTLDEIVSSAWQWELNLQKSKK